MTATNKKTMTAKQIAHFIGKRVNSVTWQIPEGYALCAITGKFYATKDLEISFPHCNFTNEQLALLGRHGAGWCEDAEWLSEEGFNQIMDRVRACGLMDVYYGETAPAVADPATTSEGVTVTPIGELLSDKQLLNGRVQYQPFAQYQAPVDPQHKDLLHTGIITTAHNHPVHGLMVRIQPDANTLDLVAAWYVLDKHVKGWAVVEDANAPVVAVAAPRECACGIYLMPHETVCAGCAHWNSLGFHRPETEPVYSTRDGLYIGNIYKDPVPLDAPVAALADELPNVAIDVIVEQEVVETPVAAAQPAHMTDAGRETGRVSYVSPLGYGYINQPDATNDTRFLMRGVLGGLTLTKGMQVSFGTVNNLASAIVICGNADSEAAYNGAVARIAAKKATAQAPAVSRPRRASINERVERKSAADKAALQAALSSVLS